MYFDTDKDKVNVAFNAAYQLLLMAYDKKFRPIGFHLGSGVYAQMKKFNNFYLAPPIGNQQGEETLFGLPISLTADNYTISLKLDEFSFNLEKDFI